jgi:hypothetical protein
VFGNLVDRWAFTKTLVDERTEQTRYAYDGNQVWVDLSTSNTPRIFVTVR